jgi:hypothetical protein
VLGERVKQTGVFYVQFPVGLEMKLLPIGKEMG